MMRASIVSEPIDVASLTREAASDSCGATAVFLGTVRSTNDGREVNGIEYSAYEEMAEKEMRAILGEASAKFVIRGGVIEHRVGVLKVGEISIAVVVAHPHRHYAMDALRYIVDQTKARATIWKLEHYADGTREWVNAGSGAPR
ncbi:MAG TPA: molybdenum cofactor biosynthesis protein MoaE [Gemmatimonadaceae bacterium]|jgi:molybdopterin synthase catalytic subunit|nr:molybdenum cofactor biosynthesis protein MoaE [Gemmatimonadaceae bacterium]